MQWRWNCRHHGCCEFHKTVIIAVSSVNINNAFQQALSNASVHDFAILEYRDTIGGRAWHKPFGKDPHTGKPYTIEMGANWVCLGGKNKAIVTESDLHRCKVLELQVVLKILSGLWYISLKLIHGSSEHLKLTNCTGPEV